MSLWTHASGAAPSAAGAVMWAQALSDGAPPPVEPAGERVSGLC